MQNMGVEKSDKVLPKTVKSPLNVLNIRLKYCNFVRIAI